jgi:hypothetical protein
MISGVARRSSAVTPIGRLLFVESSLGGPRTRNFTVRPALLKSLCLLLPLCLRCALPSPNDRVPIKIRPSISLPSHVPAGPGLFPSLPKLDRELQAARHRRAFAHLNDSFSPPW